MAMVTVCCPAPHVVVGVVIAVTPKSCEKAKSVNNKHIIKTPIATNVLLKLLFEESVSAEDSELIVMFSILSLIIRCLYLSLKFKFPKYKYLYNFKTKINTSLYSLYTK